MIYSGSVKTIKASVLLRRQACYVQQSNRRYKILLAKSNPANLSDETGESSIELPAFLRRPNNSAVIQFLKDN